MTFDFLRYLDFAMFGVGCAFMLVTNVLAFMLLRPPKKLGFLWWHITTISASFVCLGTASLITVFRALGDEGTWRGALTTVGFLLFMIAQGLILTVEIQRYAARLAAQKVSTEVS